MLVVGAIFLGFKIYKNVSCQKVPILNKSASPTKTPESKIPGLTGEEYSFIMRPSLSGLSKDDTNKLGGIHNKAAVETTTLEIDSAYQVVTLI